MKQHKVLTKDGCVVVVFFYNVNATHSTFHEVCTGDVVGTTHNTGPQQCRFSALFEILPLLPCQLN